MLAYALRPDAPSSLTPTERLAAFVADASVEITPKTLAMLLESGGAYPRGTEVYLAFMPDQDLAEMAETARAIARAGFAPVPHVPARSMRSKAMLAEYLERLAEAAPLERVLVIGGGTPEARGPFRESLDVLATGLLERHGVRSVGFAGHPEGHQDVAAGEIRRATRDKLAWAAERGIEARLVTQFCLEIEPILAWERDLRAAGLEAPIMIGLPGPATLKSLLFFAKLCGIGNSARVLKKNALKLAMLTQVSLPDRLLVGLADRAAEPGSLIRGAHFYPFGGVKKTGGFVRAVRESRLTMDADGRGFALIDGA